MWKRFLHDYLSYSKKERVGILVVLGLIILCIFIPFLYPYLRHEKQYDQTKFKNEITQLKLLKADSSADKKYSSRNFDEDNINEFTQPSEKNYYSKAPA